MKRFIATFIVVSLLISGLWWMTRRRPGGPPPENTLLAFKAERSGKGILLQYQDAQVPLRSLRWLSTSSDGLQFAQVINQSNRQQIAWFDHGVLQGFQIVPKPQGVRDGFFSFAELQDACLWPGDVAVLLYRAMDPASDELPLVLALDLNTQDIRWIHRAKGLRLIPTPGAKEGAVYLFGSKDPIVRLPITFQKTEQPSRSGLRSAAKSIELPPEVQEMGDLLPLGAWTFLVAHRGGLSTYLGVKGWTHQALPELAPVTFEDASPRLARGKNLWWQPQPGLLVQLHADGTQGPIWTPAELTTPEPFTQDSALLHLLGIDAAGRLWFNLAAPQASIPAASPSQPAEPAATQDAAPAQTSPEAPASDLPARLQAYASQGIARLYVWNPEDRILKRLAWKEAIAALQPPTGFSALARMPELHPESDGFLFPSGSAAWWLALESLPLGDPAIALKPNQPM